MSLIPLRMTGGRDLSGWVSSAFKVADTATLEREAAATLSLVPFSFGGALCMTLGGPPTGGPCSVTTLLESVGTGDS